MAIIRKAEDRGDKYTGWVNNNGAPRRNPLKATPKVSRRQVFPTGEIAHKWAHQTQDNARNPQGNLYFRGATLYSYRDSYPIAKIFRKRKDTLVLHVFDTYSNTTAGHCSSARRASSHLPCVTVPDVVPDSPYSRGGHARNIKFLVTLAAEHLAKAQRAMQASTVNWRRGVAENALQDAETYSRFFGIRRKVPPFPAVAWAAALERAQRIENPDPVRDAKRFKLREQRTAAGAATAEYRQEMIRSMTAAGRWLNYRATDGNRWPKALARLIGQTPTPFYHDMARRSAWRLGFPQAYPDRDGACMLRVNGEQIETSQGARVPLAAAPMVWAIVERTRKAGGRDFKGTLQNGGYYIGDYTIDAIDADGTLKAGCHVIPHSELRSMARTLGLV